MFGGCSLASADQFKKVGEIIRDIPGADGEIVASSES